MNGYNTLNHCCCFPSSGHTALRSRSSLVLEQGYAHSHYLPTNTEFFSPFSRVKGDKNPLRCLLLHQLTSSPLTLLGSSSVSHWDPSRSVFASLSGIYLSFKQLLMFCSRCSETFFLIMKTVVTSRNPLTLEAEVPQF